MSTVEWSSEENYFSLVTAIYLTVLHRVTWRFSFIVLSIHQSLHRCIIYQRCITIHITVIAIFAFFHEPVREGNPAVRQKCDDQGENSRDGRQRESSVDAPASPSAQYSMRQAESAVAHSTEGTICLHRRRLQRLMSNRIDPRTTDALGRDTTRVPIALSNDQSKVVVPFTGMVTAETERLKVLLRNRIPSHLCLPEPDAIRKAQWDRPSRYRRPRLCDIPDSM